MSCVASTRIAQVGTFGHPLGTVKGKVGWALLPHSPFRVLTPHAPRLSLRALGVSADGSKSTSHMSWMKLREYWDPIRHLQPVPSDCGAGAGKPKADVHKGRPFSLHKAIQEATRSPSPGTPTRAGVFRCKRAGRVTPGSRIRRREGTWRGGQGSARCFWEPKAVSPARS